MMNSMMHDGREDFGFALQQAFHQYQDTGSLATFEDMTRRMKNDGIMSEKERNDLLQAAHEFLKSGHHFAFERHPHQKNVKQSGVAAGAGKPTKDEQAPVRRFRQELVNNRASPGMAQPEGTTASRPRKGSVRFEERVKVLGARSWASSSKTEAVSDQVKARPKPSEARKQYNSTVDDAAKRLHTFLMSNPEFNAQIEEGVIPKKALEKMDLKGMGLGKNDHADIVHKVRLRQDKKNKEILDGVVSDVFHLKNDMRGGDAPDRLAHFLKRIVDTPLPPCKQDCLKHSGASSRISGSFPGALRKQLSKM
jgi:hypothetical protein